MLQKLKEFNQDELETLDNLEDYPTWETDRETVNYQLQDKIYRIENRLDEWFFNIGILKGTPIECLKEPLSQIWNQGRLEGVKEALEIFRSIYNN